MSGAGPGRRRLMPRSFRGVRLSVVREALRTFRGALRGQGLPLAGAVLLTLVVAGLELLRPWPIKLILDEVLFPRDGAGLGGWSREQTLAVLAGATLLIAELVGLATMGVTIVSAKIGRKATTRIRRQVFEHLHRLAFPFHQSAQTGDLLVRLMGDVNTVRDVLFASWITLAGRLAVFVGIGAVMIALDPTLALLALAPLPLLGVLVGRSSRKLRDATRQQRRREGDAAAFASETLRQIRVVKAYAAEDRMTRAFARDSRSSERAGVKAARIGARMGRASEFLTGLGLALVLFVGGRRVLAGSLTAGDLILFVAYTRSIYKPLRGVSRDGVRLGKATACAERLLEVLRVEPEPPGGEPAPAFRGAIDLVDVRFAYREGREALRGLSLRLEPGDLAVLAGPNGSGKSTVLALLLRLLEPDQGEVLVDRLPVRGYDLASYRGRFAYVPQDLQLFGASVADNIRYGRPGASDEDVERAARDALLRDVVAGMPDGFDTVLGEGGASLSGGEARRLMLARAAVRDARILLLDEPLEGLDPAARSVVARAIRRIAAGRTALVVSHGAADELAPDVVVRLDAGRLAEPEVVGT